MKSKTIRIASKTISLNNETLWRGGMDRSISLASTEHIDRIVDIENQSFNPDEFGELLNSRSVRYLILKGNGLILIHQIDSVVTGYAQMTFKSSSEDARFYSLAVLSEFQGSDVAQILFHGVEQLCRILKVRFLRLEIREDYRGLKKRYEQLGYVKNRRVPEYYPDGCAALKMKKRIT